MSAENDGSIKISRRLFLKQGSNFLVGLFITSFPSNTGLPSNATTPQPETEGYSHVMPSVEAKQGINPDSPTPSNQSKLEGGRIKAQEQEEGIEYLKSFSIRVETPADLENPDNSEVALLRQQFDFALKRGVPVTVYYKEISGFGTLATAAVVTEAKLQETGEKLNIAIIYDPLTESPVILNLPDGFGFEIGYVEKDGVFAPLVVGEEGNISTFSTLDPSTGTYQQIPDAQEKLGIIDLETISQTQLSPLPNISPTQEPYQGLVLTGYEQSTRSVTERLVPFLNRENFPYGLEGKEYQIYYSEGVLDDVLGCKAVSTNNPTAIDSAYRYILSEVQRMAKLDSNKINLVSVINDHKVGVRTGSGRLEGEINGLSQYIVTAEEFDNILDSLNGDDNVVFYEGWKSGGRQVAPDSLLYLNQDGHLVMINKPLGGNYQSEFVAARSLVISLIVLSDSATRATGNQHNWEITSQQAKYIYKVLGCDRPEDFCKTVGDFIYIETR